MDWSGKEAFASRPLVDWSMDGHVAGKTRAHGGLTFATVNGAGHLVRSCTSYGWEVALLIVVFMVDAS